MCPIPQDNSLFQCYPAMGNITQNFHDIILSIFEIFRILELFHFDFVLNDIFEHLWKLLDGYLLPCHLIDVINSSM